MGQPPLPRALVTTPSPTEHPAPAGAPDSLASHLHEPPWGTHESAVKAEPGPTVTVTVTETAKVTVTADPEPAPTVTKIKKVRVTVTAPPPEPVADEPDPVVDDDDDSGGAYTYYKNCTAVRAAGAAPIRRGDPGYASHLDRDGDGVGCE
ncbi:excalibur calcium-binding domain-containing protein [Streptomyces cyaneofuscatus]